MTGLDPLNDKIIEICCLLTDGDLNIKEPNGFETVIHQPKSVLDNMNQWCVEHHGKSGLTAKVLESKTTSQQADDSLRQYLEVNVGQKGVALLAGNSIHQDRLFLVREFPKIDVSTVKEIARRHNPKLLDNLPSKKYAHTARADIEESIAELRWYYNNYFKSDNSESA